MFNLDKYPWIVPVLLVFVGVGWLLNTLDIVPGVNWAYTLGVGAVGLVLLLQGLNRFSFVVGTFLIVGAFCSYLRQTGYLKVEVQVPIMVVLLGVLMLVAPYTGLPQATDDAPSRPEVPKKRRLADAGPPHQPPPPPAH